MITDAQVIETAARLAGSTEDNEEYWRACCEFAHALLGRHHETPIEKTEEEIAQASRSRRMH